VILDDSSATPSTKEGAVGVLQNVAAAKDNGLVLWEDERVRTLLRECAASGPSTLLLVLGAYQNLARAVGREMWQDRQVMDITYQSASPAAPNAIQERALSILKNLSAAENKQPLWSEPKVQAAVLAGAAAANVRVCSQALAALQNMGMYGENRTAMWGHARVREVLCKAAVPREEPQEAPEDALKQLQIEALRTLGNLAIEPANQDSMWAQQALQAATLGGMNTSHEQVQLASLRLLSNLSQSLQNRVGIWALDEIAPALEFAAQSGFLSNRQVVFEVLHALSLSSENRESMWWNGKIQNLLLDGSTATSPPALRQQALNALWCLSQAKRNKLPMLSDPDARAVLLDGAASDSPTYMREKALGTLWSLA